MHVASMYVIHKYSQRKSQGQCMHVCWNFDTLWVIYVIIKLIIKPIHKYHKIVSPIAVE